MDMTPEQLTDQLKQACGDTLKAVILYGSAAAGDHAGTRSDYNVLVVTNSLEPSTLDAMAPIAIRWARAGNPTPLLFTEEGLKQSADVFPIELLDMKACHRVLLGEPVLERVEVSAENLRLEIEHELRGKLILLRQQYLLTRGKPGAVLDLMIESVGAFLVLFRATLRLFQEEVPVAKRQALEALGRHLSLDTEAFMTIDDLKRGVLDKKAIDAAIWFKRYLNAVEAGLRAVDAILHSPPTS